MHWKYFGHGQDVVDLAWSKNSQYIVSGSMDGTVKFWSINKQKDSKSVTSFDKAVQGVAVHPNIEYIIAVGNDQVVKMIAPTTGNKKSRLYDNWYVKKNFEKYHYQKGVLEKE
jgi:WD40 repeat protein